MPMRFDCPVGNVIAPGRDRWIVRCRPTPPQQSRPVSAPVMPRPCQVAGTSQRHRRVAVAVTAGNDQFRTAQQDGAGGTGRLGHDVHAPVHPVDQIDVEEARGPEHDRTAFGRSAKGVRRGIVAAPVRLGLDDERTTFVVAVVHDEPRSHEVVGDVIGWSFEESSRHGAEELHGSHSSASLGDGPFGPSIRTSDR